MAISVFIYSLGSDEFRTEARLIVLNASERKEPQSQFILLAGFVWQFVSLTAASGYFDMQCEISK